MLSPHLETHYALQPKIIAKGKHSRDNTLQEIYDAYAQAAAEWGFDYRRCALFEDGIVAAALLHVPENDAQKFSQGLYYLQQAQPEPFARNLKLRDAQSNFYDFLRQGSAHFSGLSGACVDIFWGWRARVAAAARLPRDVRAMPRLVSKLMSNKNIELGSLMQRACQHPASRSVIY